jgi:hypothetical protein
MLGRRNEGLFVYPFGYIMVFGRWFQVDFSLQAKFKIKN